MAEQPIFPEQSAEVIQAMEEGQHALDFAFPIGRMNTKDREAAPDAFFLSEDEEKTLRLAAVALSAILYNYAGMSDAEFSAPAVQDRINKEASNVFDGAGIDTETLKGICQKVITGHYWSFSIVSIENDKRGEPRNIYEVITDRETTPHIVTKESVPEFYGDDKTIADRAAALNIPPDTLYLSPLDLSQITVLLTVFKEWGTIKTTRPHSIALAPYSNMTNAVSFNMLMEAVRNPDTGMDHRAGNITTEYDEASGKLSVLYTNKGIKQELVFYNLDAFYGADTGKKRRGTGDADLRTFCYVMQNIQQQNSWSQYHRHAFINLADMVRHGLGFREDAAFDKLVQMVVKYKTIGFRFAISENNAPKTKGRGDMFTGDVVRSYGSHIATITLGENFPAELFNQFAKFPAWAYPLKSGNAFAICQYVFSQMRTNAGIVASDDKKLHIIIDKLRETIGIKAPEEVPNRRYKDYIKAPIINAVDEINAAAAQDSTINGDFHIDIVTPNTNDINEWLRGKIEITATGEYTDYLRPLAQTRAAFLEEKKKATVKRNARAAAKRDAHRKK